MDKSIDKGLLSEDQKRLIDMINGYWVTQLMHFAAQVGLADRLASGSKTCPQLAAETKSAVEPLERVLRALTSLGLLVEDAEGRYTNTPLGALLRTDVPKSLNGMAIYSGQAEHYRSWGDIFFSVETGKPAFDKVFGKPLFDYMNDHPNVSSTFDAAMASYMAQVTASIPHHVDLSRGGHIVDIGGGNGTLLFALLDANPKLRGTLFDRPQVIGEVERSAAYAARRERVSVVGGDFFVEVPQGADYYMMKEVIHDWDDETSIKIFSSIRKAMKSDSRLLLVETILDKDNAFGMLMDINMLVMTGGKERTEKEYERLLNAAGLDLEVVRRTGSLVDVLQARPR